MVMRKALAEDGFAIFDPRMGNCVFPQFNHIGKLVAPSVLLQKKLNSQLAFSGNFAFRL